MTRIESLDDSRVADYRLLSDPAAVSQAGLFVAEGRLVVERLLALHRFRTRSVLVTPTAHAALADVFERRASALAQAPEIFVVDQPLMNGLVGFNMHRGCLALAERPPVATLAPDQLAGVGRVIVLEAVNNPDNIGGLFRSAAAFGVELVVLGPGCSDPLYRKAIRTSMAATLTVPFVDGRPWPEALRQISSAGLRVLALTPAIDAESLDTYPRDLPRVALLVGAEGAGLSTAALSAADARVRIPMRGGSDSLNVAVAASIALHHFRSADDAEGPA